MSTTPGATREFSASYTIFFAALVCLSCSVLVTGSRVLLQERQMANASLDRQRNVLIAAGLAEVRESLSAQDIADRFQGIDAFIFDTTQAAIVEGDLEALERFGSDTRMAETNPAGVREIPQQLIIYQIRESGVWVIPVWGQGLWSTMRAYLAIAGDGRSIQGVAFYEQQETPGLGGEVENPRWTALWQGIQAYDSAGNPAFALVKDKERDANSQSQVDALSGATMTSRGVTELMRFWLGDQGYGPFLRRMHQEEEGE